MLPGETVRSGAPETCPTCKVRTFNEVCLSATGYYIGRYCSCGPYSRESHYYPSRKTADEALATGLVKWRTDEYTGGKS